jgi:hypothetical protein
VSCLFLSHSVDKWKNISWVVAYKSWSSSLRISLRSPVPSSLLHPNIFLSTLVWSICSLWSSLNVTDQVSHPYKIGSESVEQLEVIIWYSWGARVGAAGWGTALQVGSRGFDSRCCHWIFSLTQSFRPYFGPGVDSASSRNEYQEYFLGGKGGRCVGLTCRLSWNLRISTSWNPQGLFRPVQGLFYLTYMVQLRRMEYEIISLTNFNTQFFIQ